MKKAFIYIGHARWGKSTTLKQITNGNIHQKTVYIKNKRVWVRKMSNDDRAKELLNFVKSISYNSYDFFILTYCPKHKRDDDSKLILKNLHTQCKLYFFVQESMYMNPSKIIQSTEIDYLRKIGVVEILSGKHEFHIRANKFMSFIKIHI